MSADARNGALECAGAQALLLGADRAELRGEGDGALAAHLRRCDACRRSARRILVGEDALDGALHELASERSADDAVHRVREALTADAERLPGGPRPYSARAEGPTPVEEAARGRRRRLRPTVRWTVAVPLAAAALAALALWAPGPDGEPNPLSPVVKPARSASSGGPVGRAETEGRAGGDRTRGAGASGEDEEGLRVETDRRFALMKTENATISVVWFY